MNKENSMKERIPGFTAEATLYHRSAVYSLVGDDARRQISQVGMVEPASACSACVLGCMRGPDTFDLCFDLCEGAGHC